MATGDYEYTLSSDFIYGLLVVEYVLILILVPTTFYVCKCWFALAPQRFEETGVKDDELVNFLVGMSALCVCTAGTFVFMELYNIWCKNPKNYLPEGGCWTRESYKHYLDVKKHRIVGICMLGFSFLFLLATIAIKSYKAMVFTGGMDIFQVAFIKYMGDYVDYLEKETPNGGRNDQAPLPYSPYGPAGIGIHMTNINNATVGMGPEESGVVSLPRDKALSG